VQGVQWSCLDSHYFPGVRGSDATPDSLPAGVDKTALRLQWVELRPSTNKSLAFKIDGR